MFRLLIAISVFLTTGSFADAVVDWSSPEGVQRLERSQNKADFFRLANHFEGQKNKMFCGPTTGVILLNAFRIGAETIPVDRMAFDPHYLPFLKEGFSPYLAKYTQDTFFTEPVTRVKALSRVCGEKVDGKQDPGYQLRQLEMALKAHGLKTSLHVVDDSLRLEKIREDLSSNLKDPTDFAVVNYHRPALGQAGFGHISPLGAYDKESDSFLILDVNPNTAGWVWVTTEALVGAMRTKDTDENRGYLLVSDAERVGRVTPK